MYRTIWVSGRQHVLTHCNHARVQTRKGVTVHFDMPNYLGTGMALCGVLRYGETINEWEARKKKRMKKNKLLN